MAKLAKCGFKSCLAEFFAECGTVFFFFIGPAAIMAAVAMGAPVWAVILIAAPAHGLILMALVAMFANVSGGHFNPAVTLGVTMAGELPAYKAVYYIAAQLVGAVIAGLALHFLILQPIQSSGIATAEAVKNTHLATPALWEHLPAYAGLFIEMILTTILVLVVLHAAVRQKLAIAPIAIGSTVAVDILAGGFFTGAAMNQARWLGSAVVSGYWADWWVYLVGPTLGACAAAVIYKVTWRASPV